MSNQSPDVIAAILLGGEIHDAGRVNISLSDLLNQIDSMCDRAGGQLVSRQAIATLIAFWSIQHPGEKPLVDSEENAEQYKAAPGE